ncbi:TPA: hypothetical protein ACR8U9_004295 [Citrobacter freundii]|uniref:hypothetical protein n=1 Tax=Citrobacter sp. Cf124 TaxID=2985074 RepID=UPI0025776698|nr:hypothetical protein [Citrobacter sp. Cf124]MDM3145555.1 hypothetical protein [Citrobacter sp. Cf124]
MALFSHRCRVELERLIDVADMEIRKDFYNGYIVDENDYTSNLTLHIRRIINAALPLNVYTFSQKLPSTQERYWGADAMVVLIDHNLNLGKICFFEAKTDRQNWDYYQTSTTTSHFSTQLEKQVRAIKLEFAVWEQFYTKKDINAPHQGYRNHKGSSCIFHELAYNLHAPVPNSTIWTDSNVDDLCKSQRHCFLPITMGEMIRHVCECNYGAPYPTNYIVNFLSEKMYVNDILIIEGGYPQNSKNEESQISAILEKIKKVNFD